MRKKVFLSALVCVLALGCGATAYAAPETMADGMVFDAEYYAETYPDLKAAFGNDKNALYNHYVQYGKTEGRKPCADGGEVPFDAAYYAAQNPDVVAVVGTDADALYQHYVSFGKAEGRKGSAGAVNASDAASNNESSVSLPNSGSDMVTTRQFVIWNYTSKDVVGVFYQTTENGAWTPIAINMPDKTLMNGDGVGLDNFSVAPGYFAIKFVNKDGTEKISTLNLVVGLTNDITGDCYMNEFTGDLINIRVYDVRTDIEWY